MKVLPEQILAWLKSTFGKDEANQVNINLNEFSIKINTFFQSEPKIIKYSATLVILNVL